MSMRASLRLTETRPCLFLLSHPPRRRRRRPPTSTSSPSSLLRCRGELNSNPLPKLLSPNPFLFLVFFTAHSSPTPSRPSLSPRTNPPKRHRAASSPRSRASTEEDQRHRRNPSCSSRYGETRKQVARRDGSREVEGFDRRERRLVS